MRSQATTVILFVSALVVAGAMYLAKTSDIEEVKMSAGSSSKTQVGSTEIKRETFE